MYSEIITTKKIAYTIKSVGSNLRLYSRDENSLLKEVRSKVFKRPIEQLLVADKKFLILGFDGYPMSCSGKVIHRREVMVYTLPDLKHIRDLYRLDYADELFGTTMLVDGCTLHVGGRRDYIYELDKLTKSVNI